MLEFIFFHPKPAQLFIDFLDQHQIKSSQSLDDEDVISIKMEMNEDEDLLEKIEERYDELLVMNQEIFENEESTEDDFVVAGIVVNLKDGQSVYADVDTQILVKLMNTLTSVELGDLINGIVDAVENPDQRTPCERQRSKK